MNLNWFSKELKMESNSYQRGIWTQYILFHKLLQATEISKKSDKELLAIYTLHKVVQELNFDR